MFHWLRMLDREVLLRINSMHHPWLDEIMWFFSLQFPTYAIVLAFAFGFYRKYRLKKCVEFLLGCALVIASTDITTNVVKNSVKRYRPTHNTEIGSNVRVINEYRGGRYGFFSAHAANTWGIVTYMFLCLHYISRHYKLVLLLYPCIVMYSRMYLGVHYPSDVLTGMVSGIIFGALGYAIFNAYFLKMHELED